MNAPIPRRIVKSVAPAALDPRRVEREFRQRLAGGARLRPAGTARRRPARLLAAGYAPRHRLRLFDTTFYLAPVRKNADVRYFVGYVVQDRDPAAIHPRIFYKDVSLVWRSASHWVRSASENWIGKGDVRLAERDGVALEVSDESTTDLPLEVQTAFETLSRRARRVPRDERALGLVLRRGPDHRIRGYRDFTGPRRRARSDPRNLVNAGRPVARFTRRNDPASLRFARGFEPDFDGGILERSRSRSRLYGGALRRFRILSRNRVIQYLFMAGPRHVWIVPPQATTTELSSYGVRTLDVAVDDELCVPGFEYHFTEDDEEEALAQIPEGFVGAPSPFDPSRSDASAWLDRVPAIREFRRRVLRRPA